MASGARLPAMTKAALQFKPDDGESGGRRVSGLRFAIMAKAARSIEPSRAHP